MCSSDLMLGVGVSAHLCSQEGDLLAGLPLGGIVFVGGDERRRAQGPTGGRESGEECAAIGGHRESNNLSRGGREETSR